MVIAWSAIFGAMLVGASAAASPSRSLDANPSTPNRMLRAMLGCWLWGDSRRTHVTEEWATSDGHNYSGYRHGMSLNKNALRLDGQPSILVTDDQMELRAVGRGFILRSATNGGLADEYVVGQYSDSTIVFEDKDLGYRLNYRLRADGTLEEWRGWTADQAAKPLLFRPIACSDPVMRIGR